jgi:hypothetical protein
MKKPNYVCNDFSMNSSWNGKVSDESCRKNHNTYISCQIYFFPVENRAVYKITKNTAHTGRLVLT